RPHSEPECGFPDGACSLQPSAQVGTLTKRSGSMLISSTAAPRESAMSGCECKPDRAQPSIEWTATLAEHWPEYVSEGLGLGLFMVSACTFGTLLAHPESPVVRLVRNPTLLRTLMGMAMGSTSAALVYSKFGKRSGAHLNPSTTLTFLRLGKVKP